MQKQLISLIFVFSTLVVPGIAHSYTVRAYEVSGTITEVVGANLIATGAAQVGDTVNVNFTNYYDLEKFNAIVGTVLRDHTKSINVSTSSGGMWSAVIPDSGLIPDVVFTDAEVFWHRNVPGFNDSFNFIRIQYFQSGGAATGTTIEGTPIPGMGAANRVPGTDLPERIAVSLDGVGMFPAGPTGSGFIPTFALGPTSGSVSLSSGSSTGGGLIRFDVTSAIVVPLPAAVWLLGPVLIGLGLFRRNKPIR
jgi:hypothetical protein